MYKTLNILILLLLTAGCGGVDDNHGYGFGFDERGETGLRVRYLDDTSPRLEFAEQMYRETMHCVGVEAPGPLVIWTTNIKNLDNGFRTNGWIFYSTATILVDNDANIDIQGRTLKHEFVHWLLHWSSQLNEAQQDAHAHWAFTICTDHGMTQI